MNDLPILRIAGLCKRFGDVTALHDIDLDVHEGEFLAIVGPSGSGKTTLVRLLGGMDAPTDGTIWLRNKRIDQVPANQRPTCMVFQSLALFPHMTVGQNIEFPLKIRKFSPAARKERALSLLSLLHLPDTFYGRGIHQCSGGEKQRVALARALAFDPEILFFDEPLSALDYRLRKTLEQELKDLHHRTGKTFVYITHSLEEAMVMSDRIAIMRAGRIEQIGPPDAIYTRPESTFVAGFMGEVNLFPVIGGNAGAGVAVENLVLNDAARSALNLTNGTTGTLMVRPEYVKFINPQRASDASGITVSGTVTGEYNLGSRIRYKVETPTGYQVTVETLREARYDGRAGDRVTLGWQADQCHLIGEG